MSASSGERNVETDRERLEILGMCSSITDCGVDFEDLQRI